MSIFKTKKDSYNSTYSKGNECVRHDDFNLYVNNDWSHHPPNELTKVVSELVKLQEDGKIDKDQLLTVLKYIISAYIEAEVAKKMNHVLKNTILKHSLS